jgi:FkbM family methyltransferase
MKSLRPRHSLPSSRLGKLLYDIAGVSQTCSPRAVAGWIAAIIVSLPSILRRRDLQPADRLMGQGPFTVRFPGLTRPFRIKGEGAFSGIREMYVRDSYLGHGLLRIQDGDVVVDFGANMGNFTNLALAHGPRVRVVAVEPNRHRNQMFWESVGLNPGHCERVDLVQAFVGNRTSSQATISESGDACAGARWLSAEELLHDYNLQHIDFLKCDIEGSEFALLGPGSPLLRMTNAVAAEVHGWGGDPRAFISNLKNEGFRIVSERWDAEDCVTVLAQRDTAS